MKQKLQYRMYHLTMYNISPIQQGIQSYHAGIEYALEYFKDKDFQQWAKKDKTVIILNGGTSQTMRGHACALFDMKIKCSGFREPDLNDALSGIAFLVDERVYDKVKYPEYDEWFDENIKETIGFTDSEEDERKLKVMWIKSIGGEKIYRMREWLKQFRLA